MTKRTILSAAALLTFGLVGPSHTTAQSIPSPYRFVEESQGLYAFGASILTNRGLLDLGPGPGIGLGAGYEVRIGGPFNFTARATYFPTERRIYDDESTLADSTALREDPMVGLVQIGTGDMTMVLLDASLRFDATGPRTWNRIQPFVVLGIGGAFVVSSDNSAEEILPSDRELRFRFRNGVTGHIGVGFELHLSDRFTVRADARDLLWNLDYPRGFLETGRLVGQDEWVQTGHLALGLSFRF